MNLRSILPNRDPNINWQLLTRNGEMDSKLFPGFPPKTKKAPRPFFLSNITTTNEDQLLKSQSNLDRFGNWFQRFLFSFLHGKAFILVNYVEKTIKTWSLPIERLIWASFFVNSLNSMLGLLEWPKSWMEKDIRGGTLKNQVKEKLENKNIRLSD